MHLVFGKRLNRNTHNFQVSQQNTAQTTPPSISAVLPPRALRACFTLSGTGVQFDAWVNLRGDLDKVQMGVATPDQLRGTYAAAHAPTGPPPPPPPREVSHVLPQSSPPRDDPSSHPSDRDGHATRDRAGHRSHSEKPRDSRRGRDRGAAAPSPPPAREIHSSAQLPLKPDPAELDAASSERSARRSRAERVRPSPGERAKSRSPVSPRSRVSRRRSPTTARKDRRERDRDEERERERRGRKRDRDRGAARSRERDRHGGDRPGRDPRRGDR